MTESKRRLFAPHAARGFVAAVNYRAQELRAVAAIRWAGLDLILSISRRLSVRIRPVVDVPGEVSFRTRTAWQGCRVEEIRRKTLC